MTPRPNVLAASGLDRAHLLRRDAGWQAERWADPTSRVLAVSGTDVAIVGDDPPRAGPTSPTRLAPLLDGGRAPVFLGLDGAAAFFAADISDSPLDDRAAALAPGRLAGLRAVGALVSQREGGLLAYAAAIVAWHRRHGFCGLCGWPTEAAEAGHLRICANPACRAKHFPRTDPVVIMLVTDGDRALLGRQGAWPPGRYSALAGYVEPGESIEEAVAREVAEEAGIAVGAVTYRSSQPWPFPSSLMLGFTAKLVGSADVRFDDDELEDVRWFERDELREAALAGDVLLPPPVAIARRLIEDWLEDV